MPKTKNFQNLTFKKKFKSYNEFHNENKNKIYKSIVNLFKEFTNTNIKSLSLSIDANIEGIEWNTELHFNRNEINVLKKDIMPYFEDIEDYEMCSEIINLTKTID